MKEKWEKWQVADLDVWGNAKEGYEVNDVYRLDVYIELPDDVKKADVVKALKQVGYLRKHVQNRQLTMDGSEDFIFLEQTKDGCPVCYLYRVSDKF